MEIKLEDTILDKNYFAYIRKGPYIRFSNTQSNHVDDGLLFWFRNTDAQKIKEVSDETSNRGTILHNYIATILDGKEPEIEHEWAKKPIENARKLIEENNIIDKENGRSEVRLVSDLLGMGGTVDYCTPNYIFDWKTGIFHDSMFIQVAFYAFMLAENEGGARNPVYELKIGHIHRDGEEYGIHLPTKSWETYMLAGLHVFERWKFDNHEKLRWVSAPGEVLEARAKTRGKKRLDFNRHHWKEEYEWPWLRRNSITDFNSFIYGQQLIGLQTRKGE